MSVDIEPEIVQKVKFEQAVKDTKSKLSSISTFIGKDKQTRNFFSQSLTSFQSNDSKDKEYKKKYNVTHLY